MKKWKYACNNIIRICEHVQKSIHSALKLARIYMVLELVRIHVVLEPARIHMVLELARIHVVS